MDTEKILNLLTECLKLLDCALAGEKDKISYAFEYILILIGESIHEILEEIESYLSQNKNLLFTMLKKMHAPFDEVKISEHEEYRTRTLRTALNKSNIGRGLVLLNFIRNEIKHHFLHLTEDDHTKFRTLYIQAPPIVTFLKRICPIVEAYKSDAVGLITLLFTDDKIQPIDMVEIKAVETLLKNAKTTKIKKQTFDEQKQVILQRINLIIQLLPKIDEYKKRLVEVKKFKGHEIDLYAPLMLMTVIGENCIKLTAYRRKNSGFDEEIKKILKANNKLLASLSYLAIRYTYKTHELPNTRIAQQTCKSVLATRNDLTALVSAMTSLNPSAQKREYEAETTTTEEPKHQHKHRKAAHEEKAGKKDEKEVRIPESLGNLMPTLAKSGSPIHSPVSKNKSPLKHPRGDDFDEIDEIFGKAEKKKDRKKASKQKEKNKKRPEPTRKSGAK